MQSESKNILPQPKLTLWGESEHREVYLRLKPVMQDLKHIEPYSFPVEETPKSAFQAHAHVGGY